MQRQLFRPVGMKELELIIASGMKAYPPRLSWQPIFYPVLNFEYAVQIAKEWNTEDESSGYAGFVTTFEIPEDYFSRFKIENVGGSNEESGSVYEELWVPAEELPEFNSKIINGIKLIAAYYGGKYNGKKYKIYGA